MREHLEARPPLGPQTTPVLRWPRPVAGRYPELRHKNLRPCVRTAPSKERPEQIEGCIHLLDVLLAKAGIGSVDDMHFVFAVFTDGDVVVQAGRAAKIFLRQFGKDFLLQNASVQLDNQPGDRTLARALILSRTLPHEIRQRRNRLVHHPRARKAAAGTNRPAVMVTGPVSSVHPVSAPRSRPVTVRVRISPPRSPVQSMQGGEGADLLQMFAQVAELLRPGDPLELVFAGIKAQRLLLAGVLPDIDMLDQAGMSGCLLPMLKLLFEMGHVDTRGSVNGRPDLHSGCPQLPRKI